jgi:hypothetical protein
MRLRVLTFNVQNDQGDHRRPELINREIRRLDPSSRPRSRGAWTRRRPERQAVAVTDLDARHRRDAPTIIAGDLNATADAACIRYLAGRQSLQGRSVCYHDTWRVANRTAAGSPLPAGLRLRRIVARPIRGLVPRCGRRPSCSMPRWPVCGPVITTACWSILSCPSTPDHYPGREIRPAPGGTSGIPVGCTCEARSC